jgi:hypothetical protein
LGEGVNGGNRGSMRFHNAALTNLRLAMPRQSMVQSAGIVGLC